MSSEERDASTTSTQTRAGKYLTFILAEEGYGLEILKVREIISMMKITSVPRTPNYVKGVINLRGNVIPVIDLRMNFGLPEAERTEETCIIVVSMESYQVGLIVDKVSEVRDIEEKDIDDPPSFGTSIDSSFLRGMGKSDERVTLLLDIEKVLESQSEVLQGML